MYRCTHIIHVEYGAWWAVRWAGKVWVGGKWVGRCGVGGKLTGICGVGGKWMGRCGWAVSGREGVEWKAIWSTESVGVGVLGSRGQWLLDHWYFPPSLTQQPSTLTQSHRRDTMRSPSCRPSDRCQQCIFILNTLNDTKYYTLSLIQETLTKP